MCAGCNTGKYIYYASIQFTGIGLSGNREACVKSHFLCNQFVRFFTFALITVKQLKETCLCTGSSFRTKKLHMRQHMIQIFQIHHKFLNPKRCTLTNCCRLCRLEMSKCKRRKVFVFHCKIR